MEYIHISCLVHFAWTPPVGFFSPFCRHSHLTPQVIPYTISLFLFFFLILHVQYISIKSAKSYGFLSLVFCFFHHLWWLALLAVGSGVGFPTCNHVSGFWGDLILFSSNSILNWYWTLLIRILLLQFGCTPFLLFFFLISSTSDITGLICWFMLWWTKQFRMTSESADGNCLAWAARDPSGHLSPYKFSRRHVNIQCLYCTPNIRWLSFSLCESFDYTGLLVVMMFH